MKNPFQQEQKMLGLEAEQRRQEAMTRIQDLMKRHEQELAAMIESAFEDMQKGAPEEELTQAA